MSLGDEARRWESRVPELPEEWFNHPSRLHGVRHTLRVHVHAERLAALLGLDETDTRLVLRAALLHDIGRWHDGVDDRHGQSSVRRAEDLALLADLSPDEAAVVAFAVELHSLDDAAAADEALRRKDLDTARALRVLALLKDADALDRVRLPSCEHADSSYWRHPVEAEGLRDFADALYAVLGP